MFERVEYTVAKIDGDYAYLQPVEAKKAEGELKCVARELLPPEIQEGTRLAYEYMQYELLN